MIKKPTLFLMTIVLCISLSGQNFISEDKQWNVRQDYFPDHTEIYYFDGDSAVNSVIYKKLFVSYDSLESLHFRGFLREEENIVYYIPPEMNSEEGVLYNFNLSEGDTATICNFLCSNISIEVTNIDTVEYFGEYRKRWELGYNNYWIEGIGSTSGPVNSHYSYCITTLDRWDLLCYHESGILKYMKEGETSCYVTVGIDDMISADNVRIAPNPVNSGFEFNIETETIAHSIEFYNTSGVLVRKVSNITDNRINIGTDNLEPGLYVINIITLNNQSEVYKLVIR